MKGNINTDTRAEGSLSKSLSRVISDESLFMTRYTANSPAEIGFASSFPGKILAVELAPGQSIICQKPAFLCGAGNINLSIHFKKKIGGFFGGEGLLDTVVTGPGKVYLQTMTIPKLAGLIEPYIVTKN